MFHKTFVQIAEFDWLPERQKGLIFFLKRKKKKKLNRLRNQVDEADTLHMCLRH